MIEKEKNVDPEGEDARVARARNYLCGYQLCLDMLHLRRYERKRATVFCDTCDCEDVLSNGESYWHARMLEVGSLISNMKNGREKLMLYYHYVRGESVEHVADFLGVSRRTGYRLHRKGLLTVSFLLDKIKKSEGVCLGGK